MKNYYSIREGEFIHNLMEDVRDIISLYDKIIFTEYGDVDGMTHRMPEDIYGFVGADGNIKKVIDVIREHEDEFVDVDNISYVVIDHLMGGDDIEFNNSPINRGKIYKSPLGQKHAYENMKNVYISYKKEIRLDFLKYDERLINSLDFFKYRDHILGKFECCYITVSLHHKYTKIRRIRNQWNEHKFLHVTHENDNI